MSSLNARKRMFVFVVIILNFGIILNQKISNDLNSENNSNDLNNNSDIKEIKNDIESNEEQNNCIFNNMEKLKKIMSDQTFESLYNAIFILEDFIPITLSHKIDNLKDLETKKLSLGTRKFNLIERAENEFKKIIKNSFVSFLLTVVLEIYEHDICTEIDENKSLQEIMNFIKSKLN